MLKAKAFKTKNSKTLDNILNLCYNINYYTQKEIYEKTAVDFANGFSFGPQLQ